MDKKFFAFLLFLILFARDMFGEIVVHKSMAVIADYIAQEKYDSKDIVFVFDIDNTIACPEGEAGSDQWLEYNAKQQAINGVTLAQAYQNLLPLYHKIQHVVDLSLVEDMIPELICTIKDSGICALGLTARYHPIVDRTITQLESLNIKFSNIADQELIIESSEHPALYKNGIVFCGNNNKGEVIFELFKKLNLKYKKIFCIDDKRDHLIKVEKAAIENGVDCTCIHYTHCQERVENFNPEQAEKDLLELFQ